jgi:hypothetical protein
VTISADATCDFVESLNTTGYFVLNAGVTLTATVRGGATAANNYVLQFSGATDATIVGNVTATQATSSAIVVRHTGTAGTLNITGNVTAGANASAHAISIAGGGSVNITGDVTGGNSTGNGVDCVTTATVTVTGDVSAGNAGYGIDGVNGLVTVTGNVYGSASGAGPGVYGTYTNITGNLYGGATGPALNPGGNATSTSGTSGTHVINGNVYASSTFPAIWHDAATNISPNLTINGDIFDHESGRAAMATTGRVRISNTNTSTHSKRTGAYTYAGADLNAGTETVYVANDSDDIVDAADVRSGTSYAGGTLTGTLAVPPASAVSIGVPVDDVVGTAAVTAADIATLVGAQIAAAVTAP